MHGLYDRDCARRQQKPDSRRRPISEYLEAAGRRNVENVADHVEQHQADRHRNESIHVAIHAEESTLAEGHTMTGPTEIPYQRVMEASRTGDVEKLIAMFADDAILMPPNDTTLYGKEEIRAWRSEERRVGKEC